MTISNFRKTCFLLILSISILAGCKKGNNPVPYSAYKGKLSLISGNSQSGIYGQDLADSIIIKITPPKGKSVTKYAVKFSMVQGNGLIENYSGDYPAYNLIDPQKGLGKIQWRLGCDNPSQKVKVYLYVDSLLNLGTGNAVAPDDSLTIVASGTKPTGWGRSCGCGLPSYNLKMATFDKKTLYMANNGLYSSTDGGINWYKVPGAPYGSTVVDVQFNSKGWMYILTANNGVYYTQDQKSWIAINNGILDMRTPTMFLVTDDLLMVSFYFDGPYLTKDNGGFWQKLLVGYSSQRFYLAKQHPNGDLYLFNDWTNLLTSRDTGKTWQLIPTSWQAVNYAAYDLEIAPEGTVYIGSDNATIANFLPQTNQWAYQSYYQYNASTQAVNNIQFYNNKVYFLVNTSPNAGIYNGTVNSYTKINTGFAGRISYYFIKPDGTFLLGSDEGFYYHN
ncbi:hypothetical protein [Mucilaginibacter sp. BT774]|uniref:WD40/YVTN/BNR-like repeat-containing protein n=1 Tax=Mucilaginibacter sp. BT774 TaxID=3062276 RepID=UPI00267595A5|nr:hypothetical protein [Mucilaginibacter sp. BT774]MDO3625048.1 hypothetical protein [Mucilaginibacter sp. BT774]